MKNKYCLLILLGVFVSSVHGQQIKKGEASPSARYELLNAEQKVEVRKVHEKYRERIMTLLKQQSENPMERREKVNQLRMERDSSLKAMLGEQLFQQYRGPVPAMPNIPSRTKQMGRTEVGGSKSNVGSHGMGGGSPKLEEGKVEEPKPLLDMSEDLKKKMEEKTGRKSGVGSPKFFEGYSDGSPSESL